MEGGAVAHAPCPSRRVPQPPLPVPDLAPEPRRVPGARLTRRGGTRRGPVNGSAPPGSRGSRWRSLGTGRGNGSVAAPVPRARGGRGAARALPAGRVVGAHAPELRCLRLAG